MSDDLCGLSGLVFKKRKLGPRNIQKWITKIKSYLLDMSEFKNPIVKDAWV